MKRWKMVNKYKVSGKDLFGRIGESVARVMYDIRKMSEHIKKTGRLLTELKAQQFIIGERIGKQLLRNNNFLKLL